VKGIYGNGDVSVERICQYEDAMAASPDDNRDDPGPAPPRATVRPLIATRLDAIADATPPPLLLGRLDPEGHTVLFGAGGIGKGTLTSSWIVGLVRGGRRVLILDYENHPGEWRRRIGSLGDAETLRAVHHVSPGAAPWTALEEIKTVVADTGADYLIIDSIVTACWGADVVDAPTAGHYAAALAQLGLPVLSLGHNTKAGDTRYPFGSVFWHNLARLTWSMSKESAGVLLACRKSNNYRRPGSHIVSTEWWDGRILSVSEDDFAESLMDRALGVIADQPLSLSQIAEAIDEQRDDDAPDVNRGSLRNALARAVDSDKLEKIGRKYRRP
jgi:hypothetical protein